MSSIKEKFALPSDDGYTQLQCPFCKEYFKLNNNEFIELDVFELFCPICGLSSNKKQLCNR